MTCEKQARHSTCDFGRLNLLERSLLPKEPSLQSTEKCLAVI